MILDVSDYQFRLPSPEVRIVSKLFWEDQGQVEEMYHFRNGRHYIVSSDESGGQSGVGGLPAACARGSAYGYPNIIDITDERNPKIVAKLMLEVNDHRNCELFLNEPLLVVGGLLDYSNERCVADRANDRCGLSAPIGDGGSPRLQGEGLPCAVPPSSFL